MKPAGMGRIIQLSKRIKELKAVLEPFAKCQQLALVDDESKNKPCGHCNGCLARQVLDK